MASSGPSSLSHTRCVTWAPSPSTQIGCWDLSASPQRTLSWRNKAKTLVRNHAETSAWCWGASVSDKHWDSWKIKQTKNKSLGDSLLHCFLCFKWISCEGLWPLPLPREQSYALLNKRLFNCLPIRKPQIGRALQTHVFQLYSFSKFDRNRLYIELFCLKAHRYFLRQNLNTR